ncbi:ABC transporter ATP-binding protein [Janthinobacterium aquaticum]|uniref:ABC transporter ATP-binding protein n=1 Tax=Janthinobacterium sp. FT58W TaxID=2654254 RepID=UPI001264D19E|nr:sn-glycerol-3-phosphate ABC transporter ATP-binding protein UgpC [Janthinobacterium sp. FT58W]KAB8039272.1 sn-glycerol-3-phosphate ABC transporter ATP-binding protein UgpC [Janthinobacterium sp. FT58W]
MSGVKLEKVVKRYDNGVEVIHGIDLEIRKGEFVVFVGPSGCGKSTLMRMVAGLESITGGTISIEGQVVNDLPPRERDIAMVFQDYALYPHKTVFDNLGFGLKLRKFPKAEIEQRVRAAAAILKIEHLLERKPRALSGGQRQRVAMGRAIVRQARLFLFDEPLSNLDALLRSEMRTEIKKLHQRIGATTIYVTHDQVEAMTLAERIVVLSGGNIMQVGTPDEIYNQPVSKFVAGFTGSPPMNFLAATIGSNAGQAEIVLGKARLALPAASQAACSKLAGRSVEFGIRPEDISLEAMGASDAELAATVVVVEPLGAETLVIFQCEGGEMTARLPPTFALKPGQQVTVRLDMEKFHLFDPQGGAALPSK